MNVSFIWYLLGSEQILSFCTGASVYVLLGQPSYDYSKISTQVFIKSCLITNPEKTRDPGIGFFQIPIPKRQTILEHTLQMIGSIGLKNRQLSRSFWQTKFMFKDFFFQIISL